MRNELAKQFEKLLKERKKKAKEHEIARSWEMSYISYWSILEDGLKLFATLGIRKQLHLKIKQCILFTIDFNKYNCYFTVVFF